MSYLVLARKYRPQTFTEVVGQEHVTRTLANAFEQDRVHHAFLFCGPRGVGKTTLARILGKALNCEQGPTAQPCGSCSACTTIAGGTAVDYHEMDGASNRGIDAIRELTDAVRYQPAALRKKVYVIDEVHMLTSEAFNALLKTLEEPPPHVTFVLATTEPHKIPNTILSRCQRYDFKLVPQQRLVDHLSDIFGREKLDIEPGAVSLLARESGGSVRDALSLSDQLISYAGAETVSEVRVAEVLGVADRALTRTLVAALARGEAAPALEAVDAAIARGVDEVQLTRAIVRHLRDLAVVQVAPDSTTLVDGSEADRADLALQARELDRPRVVQMFDRMIRASTDLAQTQTPRLVLDLALIDVAALEPLMPLGDLLDRLAELEARLGGPAGPGAPGGGGNRPRPPGPRPSPSAAPARPSASPPSPPSPPPIAHAAPARPSPSPSASPSASPPSPPSPPPIAHAAPARPSASPSASPSPRAAPAVQPAPAPVPVARPALAAARLAGAPAVASSAGPAGGEFAFSAAAIAAAEGRGGSPSPPPDDDEPPHPALAHGSAPNQAASPPGPGFDPQDDEAPPRTGNGVRPPSAPNRTPLAAGTVPGTPEAMMREWEAVIGALENARKMTLVNAYLHARIIEWKPDEVVVGFAEDELIAEVAGERESVDQMTAFLGDRYRRPVRLTVRRLRQGESTVTDQARSLIDVERQRVAALRDSRQSEAREHPATKMVLQTFGASIKEIKTDV